jgi:serine/threonine protein kinase
LQMMNGPKASPRVKTIQLRSLNRKGQKKKSILLSHLNPVMDQPYHRQALMNDLQTPKYLHNNRFSIDSALPVLPDKDIPVPPSLSVNPNNKLNSSLNRSALFSIQLTPSSHSTMADPPDSFKPKDDGRPTRLSHRHSVSTEKPSTADVSSSMLAPSFPLKPAMVFKQFLSSLSKFEQAEILDYPEIYCLGQNAAKIKGDVIDDNYGFDDDRSDYKLVTGDHIAYRYEVLQLLGKGSFGQVCKCLDHKTRKHVAIKIIRNQKRFHRQAKVEVKVLQHIKTGDPDSQSHCIHMLDFFIFRKHICITFELMSVNLYELLKSNNYRGFSLSLVRRFVVQILSSLCFLRHHRIIHCDLKPENILLREPNKSGVKVIDFGSSCFDTEKIYTYIQSRFYRAPEIILGIEYTVAIDMWSLGCIAAELYSGYPLFPGESEAEQLLCIMEVKGLPPAELLERATRKKMFFEGDSPKIVPNSRGKKRMPGTRKLEEKVRSSDENFLEFIERCLEWRPEKRITPEEAFRHEFIQEGFRHYSSGERNHGHRSEDGMN